MHSYHTLEELFADRQQEIYRNPPSHDLTAERRQPSTSKRPDWWVAQHSGWRRGRSTVVASATVASS